MMDKTKLDKSVLFENKSISKFPAEIQLQTLKVLMTNEGWDAAVYGIWPFFAKQGKSLKDCYNHVSSIYEEITGFKRFESFRSYQVYFQRLKKEGKLKK